MTTSTADNQQFETELRQTELGNVVADNKNLIIALIILAFAGAIGFGIYQNNIKKQNQEAAKQVFLFEQANIEKFMNGQIEASAFVQNFNSSLASYKTLDVYFPAAINAFDALYDKAQYKEASALISELTATNIYQIYVLAIRKSAVLENTGDYAGAISALKLIDSKDYESISGKINLDLGRLSVLAGNKDQAKGYFDKVVKSNTQNEFKSLANYYLSTLK